MNAECDFPSQGSRVLGSNNFSTNLSLAHSRHSEGMAFLGVLR